MIEKIDGIDVRAVVDPGARLGERVAIGPFSLIGPDVELGDDCWIGPHVIVDGRVTIGARTRIYPFCVIGLPPQDLKYAGEETRVEIGQANVIREYSQIHRGTRRGGGVTRIGNNGYFMVSSHVAHDCHIGDNVLFANAATLAGHVEVGAFATIGAYSGVHQFCRIGTHAYIGGYSVITRDALPYCLSVGNRAYCFGPNKVGLERSGFAKQTIRALDKASRRLFSSKSTRDEALVEIEESWPDLPEVLQIVEFVRTSRRGVIPIRPGTVP